MRILSLILVILTICIRLRKFENILVIRSSNSLEILNSSYQTIFKIDTGKILASEIFNQSFLLLSTNSTIQVWDMNEMKLFKLLYYHTDNVVSFLSLNRSKFLSVDEKGNFVVWKKFTLYTNESFPKITNLIS